MNFNHNRISKYIINLVRSLNCSSLKNTNIIRLFVEKEQQLKRRPSSRK